MINLIQKLRNQTGAGMMDIKKALDEAGGDEKKALDILRKKGQKIAAKKQDERSAKDGLVESYIHANGKVGAMIVLACETDFVAKNEEFKKLAHEIAMQVAAMKPEYISADDVPADVEPEEYEQICLLNQTYIKDDKKTINDLITDATAKLGEKIEVKRMEVFSLM